MAPPHPAPGTQSWILVITELHRYQGVGYKSDIVVISGLDPGDRQALEQKYSGHDPPCLLDSSDGRFVLKGTGYNPMDVMNCLMTRRGYKMQGSPQQRTLPNIHNKDDKVAFIYHLSKDTTLKRANTVAGGLGSALLTHQLPTLPSMDSPDQPGPDITNNSLSDK